MSQLLATEIPPFSPLEVDWIKKLVLLALLKTRESNNNRQEDDEIQILGFIIDFDEFLSAKICSGKIKLSLKVCK